MLCVVDRASDDKYPLCSAAGPEMHQKFVAATDLGVVAVRRFQKAEERSDVAQNHTSLPRMIGAQEMRA